MNVICALQAFDRCCWRRVQDITAKRLRLLQHSTKREVYLCDRTRVFESSSGMRVAISMLA